MTSAERLLARLRAQGVDVPEGSRVARTYAGRVQRSAGAWSFMILGPDGSEPGGGLGSHWPIWKLLRAPRLAVTRDVDGYGSRSIDPVDEDGRDWRG